MITYNFNVVNKDHTVAAMQSLLLINSRAVWSKVTELAWSIGESGGIIKVTDSAGRLVVLAGVDSTRRACGSAGPSGKSNKSSQAA